MRGIMGGFYRISEWIMRLSVIQVLWGICSFFYVFCFFVFIQSVAASQGIDVSLMDLLILYAIAAPFTFFPGTAAMFVVVRKWVMGDTDVPLFKTFFKGFKENYMQSMAGGLLLELIGLVFYINRYYYGTLQTSLNILSLVFVFILVLFAAVVLNFFSILVHFHMKTLQIIKNAFMVTLGNPLNSISMLILVGAIFYISVTYFSQFLVIFFMGSVMAFVSFFMFYRSFERMKEKIKSKQEAAEAASEDTDTEITVETDETNKNT